MLYNNGNYEVSLDLSTGTKKRFFNEPPVAVRPESVDLKITNRCPWAGLCKQFCHEQSTINGKHANHFRLVKFLEENVFPGMELAIGGGDPLCYPQLVEVLQVIRLRRGVANVTTNGLAADYSYLKTLQKEELIKGIGISLNFSPENFHQIVQETKNLENVVYHLIVGVASAAEVETLLSLDSAAKILFLGYKCYGHGKGQFGYRPENREELENFLRNYRGNNLLAFDNLALDQLKVSSFVSPSIWKQNYMGDEGQFSMYIDAVNWEFAISSTSERRPLQSYSLKGAFDIGKKYGTF